MIGNAAKRKHRHALLHATARRCHLTEFGLDIIPCSENNTSLQIFGTLWMISANIIFSPASLSGVGGVACAERAQAVVSRRLLRLWGPAADLRRALAASAQRHCGERQRQMAGSMSDPQP